MMKTATLLGGLLMAAALTTACDADDDPDGSPVLHRQSIDFDGVTAIASIDAETVRVELFDEDLEELVWMTEADVDSSTTALDAEQLDMYMFEQSSSAFGQWQAQRATDDHLPPPCYFVVEHACLDEFCDDSCGQVTRDMCGRMAVRGCRGLE